MFDISKNTPPMTPDCPFCHPTSDALFHQGALAIGMWAPEPAAPGHALVTTRRHVGDWFAASPAEQQEMMDVLALARDAVLAAGHLPEGFHVEMSWGEATGQQIPHLHVHFIPRYPGNLGQARRLVTGHGDPLLRHLHQQLDTGVKADIAVAFLTVTGLEQVMPRLKELLERQGTLRFLTGDQESFNHPAALRQLLDLGPGERCQLRVFECDTRHQFHPKFYLFEDRSGNVNAFVGSSNLTRQALMGGVEWNYRILSADASVAQLRQEFERLFHHPNTRVLDDAWIAAYQARRPDRHLTTIPGGASLAAERPAPIDEELPPPPQPHEIQREALEALQRTRAEGYQAGLVVLATGLGKTWLAAFDSFSFSKVLFVAHREEILSQTRETFRRIRPDQTFGFYTGQEKLPDAQIVFASIQTLGRSHHLRQFTADRFDYIVVDEFHHASANSYRRLLEHFQPRFLLGLTATPERTDGGNLLALCEENLVFRCDFWDGIRRQQLCPFQYYGVPDLIDYRNIPWRNRRFDPEALEHAVITEARAQNALEQYQKRGGLKTLAFCCSMRHADYMAQFFVNHGLRAVSVHSGPNSAPRATSLEQLRDGLLDVVCCVDMFNEGVDLPGVDTILMLRPTESRILWLQQMGRGLRRAEGKNHVTIIDYIGNHRSFLIKPLTLLAAADSSDLRQKLDQALAQELALPPGCSVTYELEAVDLIRGFMRTSVAQSDALQNYFQEFTELHGVRPKAREAYHDFRNPRSATKTYGSWVGFVARQPDGLSGPQRRAFEEQKDFLESLESHRMPRCYAMLMLEAMLACDALPGKLSVDLLTKEMLRLARRSPVLYQEMGEPISLPQNLGRYLGEHTLEHGGIQVTPEFVETAMTVSDREAFQELVREIVEWRLAEYVESRRSASFECKVIHTGGRPILYLPDRNKFPGLPEGWTKVVCDNQSYDANFVKIAVNVMRADGSQENVLPRVLRGWFGPDAGLPGTSFRVSLDNDSESGEWQLRPIGLRAGQLTLWKRYSREQIPAFFGLQFNTAIWNTGFVVQKPHIFLLTTLDKAGQRESHQYQDHFVSPETFAWQSQNRTTQQSQHGQLIRHPDSIVHLFVRPAKREPFYYCGQVKFVDWRGEQPINVTWSLLSAVPQTLHKTLGIPKTEA